MEDGGSSVSESEDDFGCNKGVAMRATTSMCTISYVLLCVMCYMLCVMCYALCVMCYALCVMYYVLCVMCYVLCIWVYVYIYIDVRIYIYIYIYIRQCISQVMVSEWVSG